MFFILSKTARRSDSRRPTCITLLVLIGLVLLLHPMGARRAAPADRLRCRVRSLSAPLPVGTALIAALENRFPAWVETAAPPDGIIILGGPDQDWPIEGPRHGRAATAAPSVSPSSRRSPGAIRTRASSSPAAVADLTGNAPAIRKRRLPCGCWRASAFHASAFMLEDRSRNTAENARFTKAMVHPKPGERWLLVTSAAHMPRAVGVLPRRGISGRALSGRLADRRPAPALVALAGAVARRDRRLGTLDDAAKEWVGLVAYRLAGNTAELFPARAGLILPRQAQPIDALEVVRIDRLALAVDHQASRQRELDRGAPHAGICTCQSAPA